MKTFLKQTKDTISSRFDSFINDLDAGMKTIKTVVEGLPVLVSLERSQTKDKNWDEKHYFVIPNHLSEAGFSLHTMRSLPLGALEINTLPKRRVFHFPNEYYEGTLKAFMVNAAKNISYESSSNQTSSLEKLADDIDSLDNKLTYGMLLIGGVAAIFNPLIGVGIAAKAVLPSISGSLVKYGLKPLGERATKAQIEKQAKEAEFHVLQQFSESNALKVINPILSELEFTLRTTEKEHDPLIDPNLSTGSLKELENEDWRELTERAIFHVYEEIINDPSKHKEAKLGPEDIRWLEVLLAGKLN